VKRPWHEIEPKYAMELWLPNPDVQGPYNENGEECPWPWEPIQLKGAPIGQYRCRYCGAMVLAGMEHVDYGPKDEQGRSWLDVTDEEQGVTADRHADALFEAKYGFCRIDCDLCKRLDEEAKARPDYDREAAVEAGWMLAMCALAAEGMLNEPEVNEPTVNEPNQSD
jgi:hypothetical protein